MLLSILKAPKDLQLSTMIPRTNAHLQMYFFSLLFFHIKSLPMNLYIIVLCLSISMYIISFHLCMLTHFVNYCIRVKTS